jgi:DNA-binding NtrC family response regulator
MNPTTIYKVNNGKIIFCGSFEEYTYGNILTCSKFMIEQVNILNKALFSDTSVLICGEPGTGKELYAEYLHKNSCRIKKTYFRFNCATTPIASYEEELFGNNINSFSNTNITGNGIFKISNGGTVLLDEISKIPIEIQSKLLNLLRHKSNNHQKSTETDFRIISTTNQNLRELVKENLFLEELYYMLSTIEIKLLPLRERPEDIALFSLFFLEESNKKHHTQRYFGPDVFNALINYSWPKNIMELKQVIERMVLISPQDVMNSVKLLERYMKSNALLNNNSRNFQDLPKSVSIDTEEKRTLKEMVTEYELYIIKQYIKKYGSLRKAAYALGTAPSAISRKLSIAKESQSKKKR